MLSETFWRVLTINLQFYMIKMIENFHCQDQSCELDQSMTTMRNCSWQINLEHQDAINDGLGTGGYYKDWWVKKWPWKFHSKEKWLYFQLSRVDYIPEEPKPRTVHTFGMQKWRTSQKVLRREQEIRASITDRKRYRLEPDQKYPNRRLSDGYSTIGSERPTLARSVRYILSWIKFFEK